MQLSKIIAPTVLWSDRLYAERREQGLSDQEREQMKSSKGKTPFGGGPVKKRGAAAHGSRKQKERDPVEVRVAIGPAERMLYTES